MSARSPRLAPLMLAAMASQALLVVLAPTIVSVAHDLGTSVEAAGQARTVTAAVAIAASLAIVPRIAAIGVPRLLGSGAALAVLACAAVAAAPTLPVFLAAHVLVGLAFAALLSAGFSGVAAFPADARAGAMGRVAGANALAWVLVNPVAGFLTGAVSWRAAEALVAATAVAALALARSAAPVPAAPAGCGPRALLRVASARRWVAAETIAYGAWAGLLTFVGALFIQRLGASAAQAGWLLAAGAAGFLASSSRSRAIAARVSRRYAAAAASFAMTLLLVVEFALTSSPVAGGAVFFVTGLAAGVRTPLSGSLGLEQLPRQPGAMMAARTAATQAGYLLGAVGGGAVIATAGYAAVGVFFAAAMAASALLVLRVDDPREARRAGPAVRRPALV
jgi:predicted MFS family arabinose efflux permease